MPRTWNHPRDVPEHKKIKNNPHAIKGHKLQRLEGGLIVRKRLPDGGTLVTVTDGNGQRQIYKEQGNSRDNTY